MEGSKSVEKTFSKIDEIEVKYGGEFTIDDEGNIYGATEAIQNGTCLILKGTHTSMSMVSAGGMTFNNFGGSSVTSYTIGGGRGTMVINGIEIDPSRLHEIAVKPQDKKDGVKVYRIQDSCIKKFTITGSASLHSIAPKWLGPSISVSVSGSGDFNLPEKHFKSLSLNLSGSGDIQGSKTLCDTAIVNLVGSGDVANFHIVESGSINLVGSGDVNITAQKRKNVSKNKIGSGSITVTERKL